MARPLRLKFGMPLLCREARQAVQGRGSIWPEAACRLCGGELQKAEVVRRGAPARTLKAVCCSTAAARVVCRLRPCAQRNPKPLSRCIIDGGEVVGAQVRRGLIHKLADGCEAATQRQMLIGVRFRRRSEFKCQLACGGRGHDRSLIYTGCCLLRGVLCSTAGLEAVTYAYNLQCMWSRNQSCSPNLPTKKSLPALRIVVGGFRIQGTKRARRSKL